MAAEIIQIDTQDFTSQTYEGQDVNLISTFDLNTSFISSSYIEFFTYDNNRNIITSDYNFTNYTIQNDGQSAGNNGNVSQITIDPEQSLINNGFDQGEYIAYFNFFNRQIGSEFQPLYIAEISSDRTEIRLDSTVLSNLDIIEQTNNLIQEREDSIYFLDFYLNFGDNKLAIANNIRLDNTDINNPTILVKLYEPLIEEFDVNSTTWVVTTFEEPVAYQVIFEDEPIIFVDFENISGPNFNIDLKDRVNNSTQNLSYSDLFSTSLTSSAQQLNSLLEEKEIDINVDYTSFENFLKEKSLTIEALKGMEAEQLAGLYNEYNEKARKEIEEATKANSTELEALKDAFNAMKDNQLKQLNAALEAQGVMLKKLSKQEPVSEKSLREQIAEKADAIKAIKENGANVKFEIKSAGDMSISGNVTGEIPQAQRIAGINF